MDKVLPKARADRSLCRKDHCSLVGGHENSRISMAKALPQGLVSCLPCCKAGSPPPRGCFDHTPSPRVWIPQPSLGSSRRKPARFHPVTPSSIHRYTTSLDASLDNMLNFSSCIILHIALILLKTSCQINPEQINLIVDVFESVTLA